MQFHLPHLSLAAAFAAGIPVGGVFHVVANFDKSRTIPYREGYVSADSARRISRLLRSGRTVVAIRPQERVARTARIIITAYSSTKGQTDSTPCITANGYNVCKHNTENVIAANFLPFGTRVKIPELFGDKEFIVQDRMNRRYGQRVDIWMMSRQKAKTFGVKRATVVVLPKEHQQIPHPTITQIAGNF